MSYNNAAAGSMDRGPNANGPKIMTTMKDFIILTKIGKQAILKAKFYLLL